MSSYRWLGRIDYAAGLEAMGRARDEVLAGKDEVLLLCEHPPVITLGRSARREDVLATDAELAAAGVELFEVSRGGQVTYHGPGQLMVYPVFRLRGTVVGLLASIAGALADVAAELGAPGARWRREPAGLWLGDRKLAACGLHLSRRVTSHGFAFNVSTPPQAWEWIVPCGLAERPVVSLREVAGAAPPVSEVAGRVGPAVTERRATMGST